MTTNTRTASAGRPKSPRRRRSSLALLIALAVVIALVAAAIGGEFYVRHRVTSCLSSSISHSMGGKVDVGLSAKPVLLSLLDKKLPYVTVDSHDATFGESGGAQLKDMQVSSRFNNVAIPDSDGQGGSVSSSSATVVWPTDAITQTVQALPFGGLITGAQGDSASNQLTMQFLGGLGSITLAPQVQGDKITVTTVSAQALGIGLPNDAVQQIVDQLTSSLGSDYPLGLRPTSAKVTDKGVQVDLKGGPAALNAGSGGGSDCSL